MPIWLDVALTNAEKDLVLRFGNRPRERATLPSPDTNVLDRDGRLEVGARRPLHTF